MNIKNIPSAYGDGTLNILGFLVCLWIVQFAELEGFRKLVIP